MRSSHFFLSTLREAPSEAELVSHQLMLRAGYIHKLGSGLYSWLPLGLRALRRVETVVREEMNRAGALEVLLPVVQPAGLWEESGRWSVFGPQLLKMKDRHERDFCFGPTHEEVITDFARQQIRSYRQLPLNFYQIHTKFRDEIRPRFGVMRAREFVMKDAYSFNADRGSLAETYRAMYDAYTRVFTRLHLKFRAVAADTGAIGGTGSHEFHVLADSGEDALAYCPSSDYAANVELAPAPAPSTPRAMPAETLRGVDTPKESTCEAVAALLGIPLTRTVKLIALIGVDEKTATGERLHVLLLRGDHMLNEIKASKLPGLDSPSGFRFATEAEIRAYFACPPGFLGAYGLDRSHCTLIADQTVAAMSDFVMGANQPKKHLAGVNWGRDLPEPDRVADIRNVVAGDASPDGRGTLEICRGIEVGHVFQLGNKYAKSLGAQFTDAEGTLRHFEMGCYGIGVSRIVAAAIEQHHDARGICLPVAIAPFAVVIVPIGYARSDIVRTAADRLYAELTAGGVDVLLDDRDERPGVLLADMDLIGIPYRISLGEKSLAAGEAECMARASHATDRVALTAVADWVRAQLEA